MSFRTRLFVVLLGAILIPLVLVALGIRREMERRLTAEYELRVQALADVMQSDLARGSRTVAARLDALASALENDNQFRLAVFQGDQAARRRLIDYAGDAMRLTGLAMLQLEDSAGRILSSGHFRNSFDRLEPELPAFLAAAPESTALLRAQTAEAPVPVLARMRAFAVGGRRFTLVGGSSMDSAAVRGLSRDPGLTVLLRLPGDTAATPGAGSNQVVRQFALPYADLSEGSAEHGDTARFVVTQSLATLEQLRKSVDLWFAAALILAGLLAIPGALLLSQRISRPLQELAAKTAAIDLDRLDQDFATDRHDEIGVLSTLLDAMTQRLRTSSQRLREAERRATVGDLSRQVNHDIKNGLIPIRNVVRHLSEVARDQPQALSQVFGERVGTLDSSIDYLDTLARNYARLSPDLGRQPSQVNQVIQELARDIPGGRIELQLAESLPAVRADPVVLRRIFENLVGNAVESRESQVESRESLPAEFGVTVTTELVANGANPATVRVTVADTGKGMTRDELDHAFDDFYTTKSTGTGLGLSIVRRLIMDLGGALRVETEPGKGTVVRVELPVV
ncbi:MAG TPA: ATP-binding protein [Gemmatimonadales bacterium]|nr:ATP-binding protein [Gemmatimonadales bacterium]